MSVGFKPMNDKEIKEKLETIAYHTHWTRQNVEWIDFKVGSIRVAVFVITTTLVILSILVLLALIHFW